MSHGDGEDRGSAPDAIKITVYHDFSKHEVSLPPGATFGELKRILTQITSLEPFEQRLLFRGVRRNDDDHLNMVGVKDMSNMVLMEDLSLKERKIEEAKKNGVFSKACEAVVTVRSEVDDLAKKVAVLELDVNSGTKVEEKQFIVLTELLMIQLLRLDTIEADGEAKIQRKIEVRRVQSLVDTLDSLKGRN